MVRIWSLNIHNRIIKINEKGLTKSIKRQKFNEVETFEDLELRLRGSMNET